MDSIVSYDSLRSGHIIVADANGTTRLFLCEDTHGNVYWNIVYHPIHGLQVDCETGKIFECASNMNAQLRKRG